VLPTEQDESYLRKLLEMPDRDEDSVLLVDPAVEAAQKSAVAVAEATAAAKPPVVDPKVDPTAAAPVDKNADTTIEKMIRLLMAWDEKLHPRHPQGEHDGGKWESKDGGGDTAWADRLGAGNYGDNSVPYVSFVKTLPVPPPEVLTLVDDYAEAPFEAGSEDALMFEAYIDEHGATLTDKTTLYRGFPYPGGAAAVRRDFKLMAILKPIGLQSTSMSEGTASDFATMTAQDGDVPILLKIVPYATGLKALPIPVSGQSEFVLSQSSRLQVMGKPAKRADGIWEIPVRASNHP